MDHRIVASATLALFFTSGVLAAEPPTPPSIPAPLPTSLFISEDGSPFGPPVDTGDPFVEEAVEIVRISADGASFASNTKIELTRLANFPESLLVIRPGIALPANAQNL